MSNKKPHEILMTEILEGTDGRKMSSSWGNVVNLTDTPNDMFGKIMSIKDGLVKKYFELATNLPLSEIPEILNRHPMEAKKMLAKEIVKMYHDENSANKAHESWEETFSKGGIPEDIETITIASGAKLKNILVENKIVESNSEFTRLISAGAIKNAENDEKIMTDMEIASNQILKVGKRRFVKIMVK